MFWLMGMINIKRNELNKQGMGTRSTSTKLMNLFTGYPIVMRQLVGNLNRCPYCLNNESHFLCDIHSNFASWERNNS